MSKKVRYRSLGKEKHVPKTVFVDKKNWNAVKAKRGNMSAWADEMLAKELNVNAETAKP